MGGCSLEQFLEYASNATKVKETKSLRQFKRHGQIPLASGAYPPPPINPENKEDNALNHTLGAEKN